MLLNLRALPVWDLLLSSPTRYGRPDRSQATGRAHGFLHHFGNVQSGGEEHD